MGTSLPGQASWMNLSGSPGGIPFLWILIFYQDRRAGGIIPNTHATAAQLSVTLIPLYLWERGWG
ncbi:hypothetical protein ACVWXF_001617 [Thermostichus sp. MS-CIW-40]